MRLSWTPSYGWCHVSRNTEDPELGSLATFEGAGLDGVIAKRLDGQYVPGGDGQGQTRS